MTRRKVHLYGFTVVIYCITSNYGYSCINARSFLVARVKPTVTKLNIQYSALLIISYFQNSLPASHSVNGT